MGWKTYLGIVLLGIIGRRIAQFMVVLQPWKVVYNHSPGPCHIIPPIENGAEDIQFLNDGKVIITSGIKLPQMHFIPGVPEAPGQFYVFDFNSPQKGATVVPCNNFPDYGTKDFGPHGLSVLNHDGQYLVFVVNHPQRNNYEKDTVEKFRYDPKTSSLTHLKTYEGDFLTITNDVVAVGPDSFYVTNMNYNRNTALVLMETYLFNQYWSTLAYYDNGKTQIAADGHQIINSANVSPDKRFVYISTSTTNELHVYARNSDGTLTFKQSKKFPTVAIDNIDVEKASGDLWIATHPVPYLLGSQPKGTKPSQVLRIKTKDGLLTDDVLEVYSNDGRDFEASSVAVYHKESSSMVVGSVYTQMLYCKIEFLPK